MSVHTRLAAALVLAALALAPAAAAQDLRAAPAADRLTYSGLLTTADGAPLGDGPRALTFRAYASPADAAADGPPLWEEAHDAAVVGGRFLVVLGSKSDLPPDARWVTVAVDGAPASEPVRLGEGPLARAAAPGNTLQDSYDNGPNVNTNGGTLAISGPTGSLGFAVTNTTALFQADDLVRFRIRSRSVPQAWEYRVYGAANPKAGIFSIASVQGGGLDGFQMSPNAQEDLLRLVGPVVNVGSDVNPATFRAFTTGATNTFDVADHFGFGGSSQWNEEDGTAHTRIEPDIDGDGGFLEIGGPGAAAFRVDGDTGTGSMTSIGSGSTGSTFNTAGSGTSTVVLPTSAVDAVEILNEGGTANANNSSPVALSAGFNTTLVRSITAPTAGYVIAFSTAELATSHTTGSSSLLQYAVSRSCASPSAPPTTQQQNTNIPASAPTGTYTDIMSVHGLFQVNAGTTTFCNVVQLIGSTTASIDDQNLSLVFVPTAYGAISSNLTDEPGDGDESDEVASAPLTAADVTAERSAAEAAAADRERAELDEILARLAELEALLARGNDIE